MASQRLPTFCFSVVKKRFGEASKARPLACKGIGGNPLHGFLSGHDGSAFIDDLMERTKCTDKSPQKALKPCGGTRRRVVVKINDKHHLFSLHTRKSFSERQFHGHGEFRFSRVDPIRRVSDPTIRSVFISTSVFCDHFQHQQCPLSTSTSKSMLYQRSTYEASSNLLRTAKRKSFDWP